MRITESERDFLYNSIDRLGERIENYKLINSALTKQVEELERELESMKAPLIRRLLRRG